MPSNQQTGDYEGVTPAPRARGRRGATDDAGDEFAGVGATSDEAAEASGVEAESGALDGKRAGRGAAGGKESTTPAGGGGA